jgi:hypothetical protein
MPVQVPRLFGQEQVRVEHGQEHAVLHRQVHGDDAVVDLAQRAAVLPLDAGGLVPFFGDRCFVDQPDDAQLVGVLLSGSR